MFCVNCGKPVESHFKFCPFCATNISTGVQPSCKNADFEIVAGRLIKYTGSIMDIIIPNNVVEIGHDAFYQLPLKSVTIPNSVKVIGYRAFFDCKNLIEVIIPYSVEAIEAYAFTNCRNLTSVTIQNGVKEIGKGAFGNCTSLISITIPDSVTKLVTSDYPTFDGCSKLANIKYPNHFSYKDFVGTKYCQEEADRQWQIERERRANGLCPKCGRKLSFWGNKCTYCNVKY